MPSLSALLSQIHRLRKHIRDSQTEIERGPRVLKSRRGIADTQEAAYKAAVDGLRAAKVGIHEREVSLKSAFVRLSKYEKQLGEAKSPRESEGKQAEIKTTRDEIARLEEEILMGMIDAEEKTAALPEKEAEIAKYRAAFLEWQKDAAERIERIRAEVTSATAELTTVELEIPDLIRPNLARLVKSYGPDGFAHVQDSSCGHCRTAIANVAKSQLAANEFVCCSSCGRALYL